jgi:hypothetical protein
MQRLIFNGFIAVLGKGWGGWVLCYSMFLAKGQVCRKHAESMQKNLQKA